MKNHNEYFLKNVNNLYYENLKKKMYFILWSKESSKLNINIRWFYNNMKCLTLFIFSADLRDIKSIVT